MLLVGCLFATVVVVVVVTATTIDDGGGIFHSAVAIRGRTGGCWRWTVAGTTAM